jgi:hypothetical protein
MSFIAPFVRGVDEVREREATQLHTNAPQVQPWFPVDLPTYGKTHDGHMHELNVSLFTCSFNRYRPKTSPHLYGYAASI